MIKELELGIIKYNDKIINHRSLIKVILNPFLRMIGFQIATRYLTYEDLLKGPTIIRCEKLKNISFRYNRTDDLKYTIIPKRRII